MLFKETYQQALAAPTGKGGKGWKYANPASMQAAYAQSLGFQFCLTPESVYDWANRHDVSLEDKRKQLLNVKDLLFVAVLNDWTLEQTQKELALAAKK